MYQATKLVIYQACCTELSTHFSEHGYPAHLDFSSAAASHSLNSRSIVLCTIVLTITSSSASRKYSSLISISAFESGYFIGQLVVSHPCIFCHLRSFSFRMYRHTPLILQRVAICARASSGVIENRTPCCTKCIANESLNVLVHNEVTITTYGRALKLVLRTPQLLVVILVVLTEREFRFSLLISQLMAKAIPVRGAKFKKPA